MKEKDKDLNDKEENDKDPDWKVPMKMPGVDKGKYDAPMGAPGGTDDEILQRSRSGQFNSAKED
jgi:hypothetical protein